MSLIHWSWRVSTSLTALLALGCGVDAVCHAEDSEYSIHPGTHVLSSPLEGSLVLSSDTPSFTTAFDTRLSGLPKVWTGNNTVDSVLVTVSVDVAYVDPTLTGNELPAITFQLVGAETPGQTFTGVSGIPVQTTHASLTAAPFTICQGYDIPCCPFGASECAGKVVLELSRAKDAFPEVRLSYSVEAGANVDDCLEQTNAAWAVEEVAP